LSHKFTHNNFSVISRNILGWNNLTRMLYSLRVIMCEAGKIATGWKILREQLKRVSLWGKTCIYAVGRKK